MRFTIQANVTLEHPRDGAEAARQFYLLLAALGYQPNAVVVRAMDVDDAPQLTSWQPTDEVRRALHDVGRRFG
jgi:hypothetical protein